MDSVKPQPANRTHAFSVAIAERDPALDAAEAASARAALSRNFAANNAVDPKLAQHQFGRLLRFQQHLVRVRSDIAVGKAQNKSVVAPKRLNVRSTRSANLSCNRHRPRRVDAAAEGSQHANAPVAKLVSAALNHDRAVVGNDRCRNLLVHQKAQEDFPPPQVQDRARA